MQIGELYAIYQEYPSVQTDTRKLQPGDIFFALKGPHFNGNAFAQKAIAAGAAYAVIDEKEFEIPGKTILVEDVLTTLQQLSTHHRQQFTYSFYCHYRQQWKNNHQRINTCCSFHYL